MDASVDGRPAGVDRGSGRRPPARASRTLPVRVSCSEILRNVRQPYRPQAQRSDPTARLPRMSPRSINAERLKAVKEGFRSLPDRYLGADPGFDATYHVKLVRPRPHVGDPLHAAMPPASARARPRRAPDVTIWTDADTWLALRAGRAVGDRRFRPPPPDRARQPRLRDRVRGHVQASRRPAAAAADPRRPRRPPPDLDADDGHGPGRAAAPRARRNARVAVRRRPPR